MLSPRENKRIYVQNMDDEESLRLCAQLREQLVAEVSKTGGHLASNLGAVELTVALHRVFDTREDRLVFDVGHQCYCHKIITGRGGEMDTLRQLGGISGFPKPCESDEDAFIAGHASNSISVALGMARARTLMKKDYNVVALLGDGALTGGLAYEGLSDAGESGEQLLVILNDNGMSIMKNVGGVANHLARQRLKPQYLRFKQAYRSFTSHVPGGQKLYDFTHRIKQTVKRAMLPSVFFEDMGFTYFGPVDGHDVRQLTRVMQWAKESDGPVVLHVRTVKGKGYPPAETTPDAFHGVSAFNPVTGDPLTPSKENFSQVFGEELCALAREDERICAVTAAMQSGTGLNSFAAHFPKRIFDVGIAEGHAVAMCGGMAKQGAIPVFAVYSTFLQRSYDMLIHDIALLHLHAVFCVDRAGLVGEDGETHHGVFDLAFLSTVPGMIVLAPASFQELRSMLGYAIHQVEGPVAVRYPRGGENGFTGDSGFCNTSTLRTGADVTLVSYGTMIGEVLKAANALHDQGIEAEVIKFNRVYPVDAAPVMESVRRTGRLVIAEEVVMQGSVGQSVACQLAQSGVQLKALRLLNLGSQFVTQGTVAQLRHLCGIDSVAIQQQAWEACQIE